MSGLLKSSQQFISVHEASDSQACATLNCITEFLNQFCVSNFLRELIQFFFNSFVSSGLCLTVSVQPFSLNTEISQLNTKSFLTICFNSLLQFHFMCTKVSTSKDSNENSLRFQIFNFIQKIIEIFDHVVIDILCYS